MKKHLLMQLQLSNITNGKFSLAQDSGWQMCAGRARQMLKLNPELTIDFVGPWRADLVEQPEQVNASLFASGRVRYISHRIVPNALATRYDFDIKCVAEAIGLGEHKNDASLRYDAVYINDPLLLRHYKAMFYLYGGYAPRYYVHSHFVDCPSSPKFPAEASLWLGQLEACQRADFNFWQCQSALTQFEEDARKTLHSDVVDAIMEKSVPYDDGYSVGEITEYVNFNNVRFDVHRFLNDIRSNIVVFFPNRISPSSNDYTNGLRLLNELLPKMRERRGDFVLICGNPNMKFTNDELNERYSKLGYLKVGNNAFNRDEFKFITSNVDISLHLYNEDTYGGTAMRECVELGTLPICTRKNEYIRLAQAANYPFLCNEDFSNFVDTFDNLVNTDQVIKEQYQRDLRRVVREQCSYEATTQNAMKIMGLWQK